MRHLTRAGLIVGLFAWLASGCGARTGDELFGDGPGFGGSVSGSGGSFGGSVSGGMGGFGAAGSGGVGPGGGGSGGLPSACCFPHPGPGCASPEVMGCVCSSFPECCSQNWDQNCVDYGMKLGCMSCGSGGFGAGGGGFGGGGFGGAGFGGGGFGGIGASGGFGGGPWGGPCCSPHPNPGCDIFPIAQCVCMTDPYCCNTSWDSLCVSEVDQLGCGSCGGTGGTGGIAGFGGMGGAGGSCGFCPDVSAPGGFTLSGCCPPNNPFACGIDTTPLPSFVPLPPGCVETNQPGFFDPSCPSDSVGGFNVAGCCKPNGMCGNDYSLISLGCVETSAFGGPPATKCGGGFGGAGGGGFGGTGGGGGFTGSCCQTHPWPGCDDPSVFTCVCPNDPYCCNGQWDSICVGEVTQLGCGSCGTGGSGGTAGGPACNPAFCPSPGPVQPCCVTPTGPCGVQTPIGCQPFGFPPPPPNP